MAKFDGITSANWFKNVAKSLGYTTASVTESIMPTTMETFNTTKDTIKELRDKLRDNEGSKNVLSKLVSEKFGEYKGKLATAKVNAISDIKSGNFNNKAREDESYMKSLGFDFDDFDFSFDDDLDDDSFVGDVEINTSNNYGTDPVIATEIINSVQTQSDILIETSKQMSEQNIALSKLQIASDREIGGALHAGLNTINNNLSILVNYTNEKSNAYIGASLKYYEDSLSAMNEILTEVKKLTTEKSSEYYSGSTLNSLFDSNGGFNIKEYGSLLKNNLKNKTMLSLFTSLFDSDKDSMSLGGGMLDSIIANPLGMISTTIVKSLIPNVIKQTFENVDKSFKSFMPALLKKIPDIISSKSTGMLGDFFSDLLGVDNYVKTSIDTSGYKKGITPFDGVTKKAIVEVIPTYLSKIYSVISGSQEILYDYKKGKFKTREKAKKDIKSDIEYATAYEYENRYDIKRAAEKMAANNGFSNNQINQFSQDIDDFFIALSKQSEMFNYKTNGERDSISKLFKSKDKELSGIEQEIFRSVIENLPKNVQLSIVADQQKAISSITNYYKNKEASGDDTMLNAEFNGTFGKEFSVKNNLFKNIDKYGKSSLDYLRNINRILLDRVPVYIIPTDEKYRQRKLRAFDSNLKTVSGAMGMKSDIKLKASKKSNSTINTGSLKTDDDALKDEIRNRIKAEYNNKGESILDEELEREVEKRFLIESRRRKQKDSNYGPVYDTVGKMLRKITGKTSDEKFGFEKGIDKISSWTQGLADKIETAMHNVIFGKQRETDEDGKEMSFFKRMSKTIRKPFEEFFGAIKEKLVGKDGEGGLIKKISDSEFFKKAKEKTKKVTDYLFGQENEEGKRSGGMFSDVANEFVGFGRRIKLYFTGEIKDKNGNVIEKSPEGTSVFDNIKAMGKKLTKNIKEWIFGSDDNDGESRADKAKGIFSGIGSAFKSGISNFSSAIFGSFADKDGKTKPKVDSDEILSKIKERAPKSIAGGIVGLGASALMSLSGFGILGSMFLGPMSGLIIGAGSSFLSQSEKFKDFLFGKQDKETKERMGGVISKSTQEFFKKHKSGIIGGTVFGTLKGMLGFGILPSFILGGPITGALTGLATSLFTRSESFKKLLFGDEEKDREGILNKVKGKFDDIDFKEKFGNIAVGGLGGAGIGAALSSFGTLGAFAFGPLTGAIAGVASGIVLSGNKWKEKIFGSLDENGERNKDGLLNSLVAGVTKNIIMPAKVKITEWKFNIEDWFEESISEPILNAIVPIKEEFSRFKDRVALFFENLIEKTHIPQMFRNVGNFVKEKFKGATDKLKEMTEKFTSGFTKILGKVASAPFKLINMVAEKILIPKHIREGLRSVRDMLIDNIKNTETYKKIEGFFAPKIEAIADFTKGTISGISNFTKKIVKNTFSAIGRTILGVVTAPFKAVGGTIKELVGGISTIKNFFTRKDGKSNQDIIKGIASGGDGTISSNLKSLAATFVPFSKTRKAAMYANVDLDDIKERVRQRLISEGKDFTEDELDKKARKEALKYHNGANYLEKLNEAKEKRANERANKRKQHADVISQMQGVIKNGGSIADLNKIIDTYTGTDKEKNRLKKSAEKQIDSEYEKKFGNSYKDATPIEKEMFKSDKSANDATLIIKDAVADIASSLKDGVKIKNLNNETSPNVNINSGENNIDRNYDAPSYDTWDSIRNTLGANKKLTDEEAKRRHIEENTLGNTQKEQEDERFKVEESEQKKSISQRILEKLSNINDQQKSHSFQWGKIFGKAGLITTAIIAGGFLLKKAWDWIQDKLPIDFSIDFNISDLTSKITDKIKEFLGFKDDDEDRTDATADIQRNDDAIEAGARGLAYGAKKIIEGGKKFSNFVKKNKVRTAADDAIKLAKKNGTVSTGNPLVDAIRKKIGITDLSEESLQKVAQEAGEEALNKPGRFKGLWNKWTGKSVDDVAKVGKESTEKFVKKTLEETDDTVISKFVSMFKSAVTKLKDKIVKKFNIKTNLLDDVFKHFDDVIKPTKLGKFVGKITSGLGKIAASATTLLTSDVTWAVVGAATGATKTETANLFHIPQEAVTPKMQIISGFFKGLLNISWFFVFELGNDILISVKGFDALSLIASTIYKVISDDEVDAAFDTAQKSFTQNYEDYTLSQQILKGNVELDVDGNPIKDENGNVKYIDESLIETFDSYNDRQNKTFFSKAGDKLSSLKRTIFGNKLNEEEYNKALEQEKTLNDAKEKGIISEEAYNQSMESINKAKEKYGQKDSFIKSKVFNPIKEAIGPIGEKISPIVNGIKDIISNIKDSATDIFNGDTIFTKEYWTPNIENDESGLGKVLFYGQRILSLPVTAPLSLGKRMYDRIKKIVTVGKNSILNVKDSVSDIFNGDTIFTKEYWTPGEENDNGMGKLSNILFYGNRILSLPVTAPLSLAKYKFDALKKIVNVGKKVITFVGKSEIDGMKDIFNGNTVFTKEYWKAPTTEDGNGIGLIGNILFYGQRILSLPAATTMSIARYELDALKKLVDAGKNSILNVKDSITDIFNGDTVFTKEYWTPGEENDNGMGKLSNILFYGNRVLSLPVMAPLSIAKYEYEVLKKLIDGGKKLIINIGKNSLDSATDILKGDTVFTKEYWTPDEDNDNGLGKLGNVLFYTQRILHLPSTAILSVAKHAFDFVKKIIGDGNSETDIKKLLDVDVEDLGKDYFKYPGSDDDSSVVNGIKKVVFYIGRGIMYPILQVKNIFDPIITKITGAISGFNSKVTKFIKEVAEKIGLDNIINDNYTFDTGGGNTSGYPRIRGPISKDNITEGIHFGGTGGKGYSLLKQFGQQTAAYPNYKNGKPHYGVDRSTGNNASVPSFTEGTVTEVVNKYQPNTGKNIEGYQGGFGNYVKVRDGNGGTNIYGHLNRTNVKPGDKVNVGDKLGIEGNTGHSTGTHLHYETWNGSTRNSVTDPYLYLKNRNEKKFGTGGLDYEMTDNKKNNNKTYQKASPAGYNLFMNEYEDYRTRGFSVPNHYGYDLAVSNNYPIKSFTDGTVEKVVSQYPENTGKYDENDLMWQGGYGNHVIVRDSNNNRVYYAHLNKTKVNVGDKVTVGDVLGLQGHTGCSTASHLHLETRIGEGSRENVAKDPVEYLRTGKASQTMTSSTYTGEVNSDSTSTKTEQSNTLGTIFEPLTTSINGILETIYRPISKLAETIQDKFAPILGSGTTGLTDTSSTLNTSKQAVVSSEDKLGDYVKQFESGNNGSSTIADNPGDTGGRSFGTYQFATFSNEKITDKSNGLYKFWNRYYASQYPGVFPGDNNAFINAWKDAVNKNPKQFAANEWEEIARNNYIPMVKNNKSVINPDNHSRAAQEMLWSTAVHYGPYTNVIKNALNGYDSSTMSDIDLINRISDYKTSTVGTKYFTQASQSIRNSVKNRFDKNERNVLLGLSGKPPIQYTVDGTTYGTGGDNSIYTSGIGGDEDFTYTTNNVNKFKTTNTSVSTSNSINELKESINDLKVNNTNNTKMDIPEKLSTFLDKVLNVLTEISDNTKQTSDNVNKLNKPVSQQTQTSQQPNKQNSSSNNTMYDIANKRREEKKNSNYRDAKLIASGVN